MNKTKTNTIVDMLIFILMLSLFFSKGDMHETTAYILGGCIILHMVMHWDQFKAMYRKLIPDLKFQVVIGVLVAALAIAAAAMPSYLQVGGDREEMRGPGYGYHQSQGADWD